MGIGGWRRSERVYAYGIIAVCAVMVVFFTVRAVTAYDGKAPDRPGYESAAPPQAVQPPDDSIVDLSSAARPPISDADYLALHRRTRLAARALAGPGWRATLDAWAAGPQVPAAIATAVSQYLGIIRGSLISAASDISVRRPVNGRSQTSALVTVRPRRAGTGTSASLAFTFLWQMTPQGWKITSVSPSFQGQAAPAPSSGD